MQTIILAGGLGTRLRSVVDEVPKPLAPINGIPYLAYMLRALHDKGINDVVLSIGYKASAFDEFVAHQNKILPDLQLHVLVEEERLGTGGAVKFATEHYASDSYLIFNGDSFCDFNLPALQQAAQDFGAAMVVAHVNDMSRYGEVTLRDDGTVEAFHEKKGTPEGGWINAGMYLLPATAVESAPSATAFSLEEKIIPSLLARGLYAVQAEGSFIDIGIPEDYQAICESPLTYFSAQPEWGSL